MSESCHAWGVLVGFEGGFARACLRGDNVDALCEDGSGGSKLARFVLAIVFVLRSTLPALPPFLLVAVVFAVVNVAPLASESLVFFRAGTSAP